MLDPAPLPPLATKPLVSGPPLSRSRKRKLTVLATLLLTGTASLLLVFLCDQGMVRATAQKHSSELPQVPQMKVGLVLGCSEFLANGNRNLYFVYRIRAAVELYEHGKCEVFIVSGDHGTLEYNEPEMMKAALVRGGIPEDRVYCDYAGFRTLDSVVRAKKVFGLDQFIVVSQAFHNERAIYLAEKNGIEIFGYDAEDVRYRGGLKTRLREKIARVKTILDVSFLRAQPRYLGTPISIPETNP